MQAAKSFHKFSNGGKGNNISDICQKFSAYRFCGIVRRCVRFRRPSSSERIAYAEIQRRVLHPEVLNPALSGRFVRVVQFDAPVDPEYEETEIEPRAESGIESQLFVESVDLELRFFAVAALSEEPDVADIEKERALQDSPDWKTGFEVRFEFEVPQLSGIVADPAHFVARAERPGQPAAHTVAAAAVEQPLERDGCRIAVSVSPSAVEAIYETGFRPQYEFSRQVQIEPEILGVPDTEQFVILFPRRTAEQVAQSVDQVTVRFEIEP